MRVLVIGGTRNLGHRLVEELIPRGHQVTVLNRGRTPDALPAEVERLRADRTDAAQLARALRGRSFDAVVDTALYRGEEVPPTVAALRGRVGHYLFVSTGQVYLVRDGIERPFREESYPGPLLPEPAPGTHDHGEWAYGMDKRAAEDALRAAWEQEGFPSTVLRLPMVNSERDHFHRLYGYLLRLRDGGPLVAPATPDHPLRHVYVGDAVAAMLTLIESGRGKGKTFNISQDETVSLDDFLALLGDIAGVPARVVRVPRLQLEAAGLLPACSPFSARWMSELDNRRGKAELGLRYTPLRTCLESIVAHYAADPPPVPAGYRQRPAELSLAHRP